MSWTDEYKVGDKVLVTDYPPDKWLPAIVCTWQATVPEKDMVWVTLEKCLTPILCYQNQIKKVLIFPKFVLH